MKPRLMEYLACPKDGEKFILKILHEETGEILEGNLICSKCKKCYEISKGIPRFVDNKELVNLNECFKVEWKKFLTFAKRSDKKWISWLNREKYHLIRKLGLTKEDLRNKICLDMGCGSGRYVYVTGELGATVIGVELTEAADAAYKLVKNQRNGHIIQADLFNLPLRKNIADIIWSTGVLHHTPDPEGGFEFITRHLKNGGTIMIWLYGYWGPIREAINSAIRKITTKLPLKLVYYLTFLTLPLSSCPYLKNLGVLFPIGHTEPFWWMRFFVAFDRYTAKIENKYRVEDIIPWFTKRGFKDITITSPTWFKNNSKVRALHPCSGYPRSLWWLTGKYDSVGIRGVKP